METVLILIKQVLIMYALMFIGFLAYKKKFLSDQGAKDIGKILLNIVVVSVIISNLYVEKTPEKTVELLSSSFISLICMALSIFISYLIFHKNNRIAEFACSFSNAGFIGIPLAQATFGNHAVFYLTAMLVLVALLQWTYGVYTITDDKRYIDLKKVIRNPIVIAVIIGIILYITKIKIPVIVTDLFGIINSLNTPLAMFVSGVYLAQSDLLSMLKKKDVYFICLIRLIVIPLVILLVFRFLPLGNNTIKLAVLLAGACPCGANVAIFAQQYDCDYKKGIEYVCVSTLLSILTIPFIIYLATLFF